MAEKVFINMRFTGPDAGAYSRGFEAWAHAAEDMEPVMQRIGDDVVDDVGQMFGTQGAAAGAPWKPLSTKYEKWKEQHYPGRPILVRTGAMRREMLDKLSALHTSKDRMLYEPLSGIAMFHQRGGRSTTTFTVGGGNVTEETTSGRLPRRPMVAFTEARKRQWDRYWAEWLAADRDAWLP